MSLSLMESDPIKVFKPETILLEMIKLMLSGEFNSITMIGGLRRVEGLEPEDKPWDYALPPSMELDGQGNLLSEEHDSGPTKLVSKAHDGSATASKRICSTLLSVDIMVAMEEVMVRDISMVITEEATTSSSIWLPDDDDDDDDIDDIDYAYLQVLIRKILGFVLVLLFIYQYLMGYVERGQWNTYSNGAWEFRATYVCIELRLGSYPFQKFRETPRKYSGVTERKHPKTGVIYRYEPWVKFRKPKFYFQGQTTAEKAARIRDVAKFWLKIKERKGYNSYNFGEEDYNYLNFVQEFHEHQKDDEIKRLVLEHAQRFLKEVQQSQEVSIVYQPCVDPARFANCEHIDSTIEGYPTFDSDEINHMMQVLQHVIADEHTTDMIQEPQSVSANLEFACPTLGENAGEGQGVFSLSVDPSLNQPRCTSKITLMAPCNCIADISDVEVFQREKWQVAAFKFAASDMSRRCELEGCSEIMHDHICLQKSGNVQELFWSDDMLAVFNHLKEHGWKQVPF